MGCCSSKDTEKEEELLQTAKQRREEEKLRKERQPYRTHQSNKNLANSRIAHLNWDGNQVPKTTAVKPKAVMDLLDNNNIEKFIEPAATLKDIFKSKVSGDKKILTTDIKAGNNDLKLPAIEVPVTPNGSNISLQITSSAASGMGENRIPTPMPVKKEPSTLEPVAPVSREGSWYNSQLVVEQVVDQENHDTTRRKGKDYTKGALIPSVGSFMQTS